MKRLRLILCGISLWLSANKAMAELDIHLYTPFDFEPFVIDKAARTGLIYNFTQALNERGKGLYRFSLRIVPRIPSLRLQQASEISIVPFVDPEWFDDAAMKTFGWSKPLMSDCNIIISHPESPVESLEESQLRGKRTVVGPMLYHDAEIKQLIAQKVIASDSSPALLNALLMVARKRDDFLITGRLFVSYLIKTYRLASSLHLSSMRTSGYKMRILLNQRENTSLLNWLNQQIDDLAKDNDWQDAVNYYMPEP